MRKNRRGASLVLVIMLMAFVMIVGMGVVFVASSSSGQTSVALTQRQADLTAQSVLDAVVAKVRATSNPIDPTKSTGNWINGTNSKLGSWQYKIEPYKPELYQYKISVDAYYPNKNGAHSKMNRIVQGTLKQSGPSFNMIGQSTGIPSVIGDSFAGKIQGALLLNETGKTLELTTGATITGDIKIAGGLKINSNQVNVGIPNAGNVIQATEGVTIISGTANADITSGSFVDIGSLGTDSATGSINAYTYANLGHFSVNGNVNANSYVISSAKVSGDINSTSSTVTINGEGAQNISANGNVTLGASSGTVRGNINTNGSCFINGGTVQGNINAVSGVTITNTGGSVNNVYTNGNVTISGGVINGNIYALGTVTINNSPTITGNIYSNSNVIINGGNLNGIYAYGNITVNNWPAVNGAINLNGTFTHNVQYSNLTGKVVYGKVTKIGSPQVSTVQIPTVTKITVDTDVTNTTNNLKNQMSAQKTSMNSCVFSIDLTSKTGLQNCYTYNNGYFVINKNCTFSIQPYSQAYMAGGSKILLDATNQDLYISMKPYDSNSKDLKFGDGVCILTRGTHKVYLFMGDDYSNYVNLGIFNNSYNGVFFGNENYYLSRADETPNLYIVSTYQPTGGQPQQKIDFSGNSTFTLYGYIYAPYSLVNLSVTSTYAGNTMPALCGAAVGTNINFSTWYDYKYKDPSGGSSGSGSTGGALSWQGTDCKVLGTYVG